MGRKVKEMRLTDDERQFIEENHGLLLKFIHQHNIDMEQHYGALAERFCRCLRGYDKSKGAFSTYVWRTLTTEYRSIKRIEFAPSRYIPPECLIYLDQAVSCENDATEGELIGCDEIAYSDIEIQELIRDFKEYLYKNCREKQSGVNLAKTLDLLLEGRNQAEIGKCQGITQQAVGKRIEALRKMYNRARRDIYAGC